MTKKISKTCSLSLDLLRFCAAVAVAACHVMSPEITGVDTFVEKAGVDAVMIFFVLSGFVICLTEDHHRSFKDYASARLSRLWSVMFPAIIVTLSFDFVSHAINPAFYNKWALQSTLKYVACPLIDLAFMNESWGRSCSIGSNFAVWSLGYEATYYLIYGLGVYLPAIWSVPIIVITILIKGPFILLYYPIWYAGVFACQVCLKMRPNAMYGLALTIASIGSYIVLWVTSRDLLINLITPVLESRFGEAFFYARDVEWRFVVGGLTFCLIIGLYNLSSSGIIGAALDQIEAPIRTLASATFSVYLLHMPTLVLLTAIIGYPLDHQYSIIWIFIAVSISILLGLPIERRKRVWRRRTDAMLGLASKLTRLVWRTAHSKNLPPSI